MKNYLSFGINIFAFEQDVPAFVQTAQDILPIGIGFIPTSVTLHTSSAPPDARNEKCWRILMDAPAFFGPNPSGKGL